MGQRNSLLSDKNMLSFSLNNDSTMVYGWTIKRSSDGQNKESETVLCSDEGKKASVKLDVIEKMTHFNKDSVKVLLISIILFQSKRNFLIVKVCSSLCFILFSFEK